MSEYRNLDLARLSRKAKRGELPAIVAEAVHRVKDLERATDGMPDEADLVDHPEWTEAADKVLDILPRLETFLCGPADE